ncbi:unnamed protein product [Thlaspi arvense]|uniref:Uncharacterized protein n=1 Tax=Thlaspi arvense TaxID=13288 RepID=A0AAU9SPR0_THLAR|nr:unnamed protein product [Thlaspi arvense]
MVRTVLVAEIPLVPGHTKFLVMRRNVIATQVGAVGSRHIKLLPSLKKKSIHLNEYSKGGENHKDEKRKTCCRDSNFIIPFDILCN